MTPRPSRAFVPLPLLAEVLRIDPEPLAIVLAMVVGLKGVRLVGRPGAVVVVDLPAIAAARLGLAKVGRRWARPEGDEAGTTLKGTRSVCTLHPRAVRLDASRIPLPDPRSRTPLEELAAREELPDRIVSLRRWLAEWERTGERPKAPGMGQETPAPAEVRSPRAFDLGTLRGRLEGGRGRQPG